MGKKRIFCCIVAATLLGSSPVPAVATSAENAKATDVVDPDCLSRPIPLQVGGQKFHLPHVSILRVTVIAPRITRSARLDNAKHHQMICKLTDNGRKFLEVPVFEFIVIVVKATNSKYCDSDESMPQWLERLCADPRGLSEAGYPMHVGVSDIDMRQSGIGLVAGITRSTHLNYIESRRTAAWKENVYIVEADGKVKRYADNYLIAKESSSKNGEPLTAYCSTSFVGPRRSCFVSYVSAPDVKTQWSFLGEEEIVSKQLLRTYPIVGQILDSIKVDK